MHVRTYISQKQKAMKQRSKLEIFSSHGKAIRLSDLVFVAKLYTNVRF